jgi:hypothetical protein
VAFCPPVVSYGAQMQAKATEEVEALPEDSAVAGLLSLIWPLLALICNVIWRPSLRGTASSTSEPSGDVRDFVPEFCYADCMGQRSTDISRGPGSGSRISRRSFTRSAVSGVAAFGGLGAVVSTQGATAQEAAAMRLDALADDEASTLAAWCDVMVPGAAEAGVTRFVGANLSKPHTECLLLIRYLRNPPFIGFYQAGIAGIDAESRARFAMDFLALGAGEREAVVQAAATSATVFWKDPDPSFFYFISRSDAVDVVYGTPSGFARLGIPYNAHIRPGQPW